MFDYFSSLSEPQVNVIFYIMLFVFYVLALFYGNYLQKKHLDKSLIEYKKHLEENLLLYEKDCYERLAAFKKDMDRISGGDKKEPEQETVKH